MHPIPYGRHHITSDDIAAVTSALQADFLTQGPCVELFEAEFARYVGSRYAVAVANGTAALHLCAMVLNVAPGHRVITTPITFAASANCVRYCGGDITFADIDPATALIDIDKVAKLLESAPAGTYQGIIPVDFAGQPVNLEVLRSLADRYGLWIIEDACHAPGGAFLDSAGTWQRCGNCEFADLAIFSLHPVKHIAAGEGGIITTNNPELYQRLLKLRIHGVTKNPDLMTENHGGWYYEMQELGYNYRLTEMQAALGNSQLARANAGLARRREIAARYDVAFAGTPVQPLKINAGVQHAYHLYVVSVAERKRVYDELKATGIHAQVHYIPVHQLPYYQQLGYQTGSLPHAEAYYKECLSLPMFPSLTDAEQQYVIETLLRITTG